MSGKSRVLIALVLPVLVLAVFSPCLSHPFIVVDDISYIKENPRVFSGLSWANAVWAFKTFSTAEWQPLTWLSLQATASLAGTNPFAFHLTDILLHAANTALIFLFFWLATKKFWQSLIVAALFGLHPLRVESVAWAAERKDVQSVFFACCTFLAYLRYARRPSWPRYACVLVLFCLGLLTKPMLVTLPLVLLLFDIWPLDRVRPFRWGLVWEKVPLLVLSFGSGIMTILAAREVAWMPLETMPLFWRAASALTAPLLYIEKMVMPFGLAMFYPHPGSSLALWKPLASLALILIVSLASLRWFRNRPYLFTGWLWFLVMLGPVAGLTQQSMADRFSYLPLTGLFAAIVWSLGDWASARQVPAKALGALALAILAAFSLITYTQVGLWKDSITLLGRTVANTQGNYVAHAALSKALLDAGRPKEAFAHYAEAARISPSYMTDWLNDGANLLLDKGQPSQAIINCVMANELKKNHAPTLNKWGVALAMQGDFAGAEEKFLEARRADPRYAFATENLRTLVRLRAARVAGLKGRTFSFAK